MVFAIRHNHVSLIIYNYSSRIIELSVSITRLPKLLEKMFKIFFKENYAYVNIDNIVHARFVFILKKEGLKKWLFSIFHFWVFQKTFLLINLKYV